MTPKIAYLVKTFPRLSETFILNEVLGLEKLGMELAIFSLKRPAEGEPRHPAVANVKARVTYVPALGPRSRLKDACMVIGFHLTLLVTRPKRYMAAARFHFGQPGRIRIKHFVQAGYLAGALRRGGFGHLHVHFANVPVSVAEVATRMCGIRYSFTAHAKDIYLTPADELARKIAGATCVLTCTGYNQKHLAELAGGGTPVRLAYHGVDVSRFSAVGRTAREGSGVPLILSVGRYCEKKGFPDLIRACRLLKDAGHRFLCRIVGYGELEERLRETIAELEVGGCVELAGRLTQDEVAALYRRASLFVLPSFITEDGDRDGIPNVLIEAMMSGVPVISTNVSGIAELVEHQRNGLLVTPRSEREIAAAISLLLERPDVGRQFAEKAREKVLREFTLEGSAARVRELLLEAAGGPHGAAEGGGKRVLTAA